jgi:DNA-binding CsgD family transcriptional regulator
MAALPFDVVHMAVAKDEHSTAARFYETLDVASGTKDLQSEFVRIRALLALGEAGRVLDIVRELGGTAGSADDRLQLRMFQGIALVRLSKVDRRLAILNDVHGASEHAHPTVRADVAVNLAIAHFQKRQYLQARSLLETVSNDTGDIRARATLFEGWIAVDCAEPRKAVALFRDALDRLDACPRYDQFIEASALYGLAFLCSEIPLLDLWDEVRRRVIRFDWSAPNLSVPRFWVMQAASLVAEMRGEFDESREWASRAEAIAETPACEILSLVRLASLVGSFGEVQGRAYFTAKARRRYEACHRDGTVRDDAALLLSLIEELAEAGDRRSAARLLARYTKYAAPRVRGAREEAVLAATFEMSNGMLQDAAGRSSSAKEWYTSAFGRYVALGFNRRAASAAYRLAVLTRDERYRVYAAEALKEAADTYWLKRRLTDFSVADIRLSDRQAEVLRLLVQGKTNKGIAAVRGGSWYTARNIVRELLDLFHVHSRSELVRVAIARGVVPRRTSAD